jgi:putative transposase
MICVAGKRRRLRRALDQEGFDLDESVQSTRNAKAAKRLLIRLFHKQGMPPKRIITDIPGSYGAARKQVMPHIEHRPHKGLNNRAEHALAPLRKRQRMIQGS